MGSITQKIFDLLADGANYEESRGKGIIIKCGWFDSIDDDGRATTSTDTEVRKIADAISERKQKACLWNALNEIP